MYSALVYQNNFCLYYAWLFYVFSDTEESDTKIEINEQLSTTLYRKLFIKGQPVSILSSLNRARCQNDENKFVFTFWVLSFISISKD